MGFQNPPSALHDMPPLMPGGTGGNYDRRLAKLVGGYIDNDVVDLDPCMCAPVGATTRFSRDICWLSPKLDVNGFRQCLADRAATTEGERQIIGEG